MVPDLFFFCVDPTAPVCIVSLGALNLALIPTGGSKLIGGSLVMPNNHPQHVLC